MSDTPAARSEAHRTSTASATIAHLKEQLGAAGRTMLVSRQPLVERLQREVEASEPVFAVLASRPQLPADLAAPFAAWRQARQELR